MFLDFGKVGEVKRVVSPRAFGARTAAPFARSNSCSCLNHQSGMSLVEVLVAAAVIALFFGGLMASFQGMLSVIGLSKEKSGATSLANERIEYIKSLPYDSVGTEGGIPNGSIPQNATTTLNGITYTERVLISYVDSPDDGEGVNDDNGILADYKQAKVEYTWSHKGISKTVTLVSNIVPSGIESTVGGGTLTVNVFDASVAPVEGASVRVYNNNGTSTIDTTRYTNSSGIAQFAGADALSGYEITVTKGGYSTDGTYNSTVDNPNPSTPAVSVVAGSVSTTYFAIDVLSNLTIETVGVPTEASSTDTFVDSSGVALASGAGVSGGAVVLDGTPGSYSSNGSVQSVTLSPATFERWNDLTFNTNIPANTALVVQVYAVTATSTALIPESVLVGNAVGFSSGPVDLSGMSAASYPSIALLASLATSDASSTPELLDWTYSYIVSEPPIGNVSFNMNGGKTIGTNASSSPIYKYDNTHSTDAGGSVTLSNIEWDSYSIALNGSSYNIAEACGGLPYSLSPGVSDTLKLTLDSAVTNSLRVRVVDTNGNEVTGLSVTLSRTGYTNTQISSACGQVFFNDGLTSASDYQIDVSGGSYGSVVVTGVSVSGETVEEIIVS